MATLVAYTTRSSTTWPTSRSSTACSGYSGPATIGEASRKPATRARSSAYSAAWPANSRGQRVQSRPLGPGKSCAPSQTNRDPHPRVQPARTATAVFVCSSPVTSSGPRLRLPPSNGGRGTARRVPRPTRSPGTEDPSASASAAGTDPIRASSSDTDGAPPMTRTLRTPTASMTATRPGSVSWQHLGVHCSSSTSPGCNPRVDLGAAFGRDMTGPAPGRRSPTFSAAVSTCSTISSKAILPDLEEVLPGFGRLHRLVPVGRGPPLSAARGSRTAKR